MEANYEAGHLFQHSPRLVAVHPKLLPVPSEGAPTDELDAPEEVFASLLEKGSPWDFRDAWTRAGEDIDSQVPYYDGIHIVSYRDIRHEIHRNFTGEECTLTPNSTGIEPSPSPQRNTPVYYDFPSLDFNDSEFAALSLTARPKEPSVSLTAQDWLSSLAATTSLPQVQRLRPRRKPKRFDLPLLFKSGKEPIEVMACPDSGSDDNIISEKFTKDLGLPIEPIVDKTKHFSLANGRTIDAVGQVSARFSFALGSSSEESLPEGIFYVFRSLAVSVIMGMEFLQRTETLTKHTDRMIEQLAPSMQALRVNSIGKAKRNLICRLGTYTGLASPDTGSDLDLVSPEFAKSRAFDILPAQATLQFADCSIGYTSGVIQAAFSVGQVDDCQGFVPKGGAQVLEFHVLDNLTTDILLGQETIEALDIFNEYADSIIPSIPSLGQSDVSIIRHIGAVEAFCSRKWSKVKNKDPDETPVTYRDLTTATQRENARLDTARSRYQQFDEATVAAFAKVEMSAVEEARRAAVEVAADNAEVKTQHSRIPNLTTRRKHSLNLRHLGYLNLAAEPIGSGSFSNTKSWSISSPMANSHPATNGPVTHDSQSDTSSSLRSTYCCMFSGCTAAPFMTQYLLDSHMNGVHS